ncbi:lysoplasmalogenase [Seongchinamella sediminis]|uniref:Lysoplasmalogenase n=1 Tax=Seongchinamella sediminis TaxID=2283635 RepID=A0A3L7E1N6_9GAMM|nr:lysoplasmalogenase [Seongchinamella sediminis]RLQ23758.1 lysoplasmalogenase [Seongchinamella sediminis]
MSVNSTDLAPALLLAALAVSGLVASDWRRVLAGRFVFKPLAALSFIWLAVLLGATQTSYGQWLLAGLLLCALGDVLLMFEAERAFLAGLLAFLCGHLLYAAAFTRLPVNTGGLALSAAPALVLMVLTLRWLRPHLQWPMKAAVPLYILVIVAMLVFAGGTWGQPGALLILAGAWGFAFSDLAVARRQFVNASRRNGLWGTPLYFGAQLLLAASVAWQTAA